MGGKLGIDLEAISFLDAAPKLAPGRGVIALGAEVSIFRNIEGENSKYEGVGSGHSKR